MVKSDGAWLDDAVVTITEEGGTDYDYQALTESVDIDLGDRDIEGIAILSGGRIKKYTPEGDTTVTLECYAVEASTPDNQAAGIGRGFFGHFWDAAASDPQQITATRTRYDHRIVILWTDDTSITTAPTGVTTAKSALRFIGAEGNVTSIKPSFTDGILKFTVTLKFLPYDKEASGNIRVESVDSTSVLATLNSYCSNTKW